MISAAAVIVYPEITRMGADLSQASMSSSASR
jgi:hypothetical protein